MSVAGGSAKRGLALVQGNESDLRKASGGQCNWFYNWSPAPTASVPSGLNFVPMQWGRANVQGFADTVRKSGAKTILGFNEPDMAAQSNIPATEAATLWQQYIQPLKSTGVRLGSPAISSGPSGLPWLVAFMQACDKCTIDFIAVHWYGEGVDNFSNYLANVHAKFPKPIWVTEFASTGNGADTATFMMAALEYLDGQSWIERYSWFAFAGALSGLQSSAHLLRTASTYVSSAIDLLDGSGNLNALGTSYIGGSKARRGHAGSGHRLSVHR
ncbi:glycosyl hydrolase catalytic core-domain-containing protein [Mycena galericulata]|nr:glycosyl hydrolase catalytic core-domain-containing protein [Mycena galericulata]